MASPLTKSGIRKGRTISSDEIKNHGTICLPLIDSENSTDAASIAKIVEERGASAILVGGSSVIDQLELAKPSPK